MIHSTVGRRGACLDTGVLPDPRKRKGEAENSVTGARDGLVAGLSSGLIALGTTHNWCSKAEGGSRGEGPSPFIHGPSPRSPFLGEEDPPAYAGAPKLLLWNSWQEVTATGRRDER